MRYSLVCLLFLFVLEVQLVRINPLPTKLPLQQVEVYSETQLQFITEWNQCYHQSHTIHIDDKNLLKSHQTSQYYQCLVQLNEKHNLHLNYFTSNKLIQTVELPRIVLQHPFSHMQYTV